MIKFIGKCMAVAAVSTMIASPVLADPAEKAIKARQGYFQMLGFNLGGLAAMAKGEAEYDAEKAKAAANNLDLLSQVDVVPTFPAGSDNVAKKGKTRSLPKIWENFPDFGAKAKAYREAVVALAGVAGDGKDALGPAVGALGKTCGECHNTYRAKTF